eukprot:6196157-Pleurochrysis_carterae.AAC.1
MTEHADAIMHTRTHLERKYRYAHVPAESCMCASTDMHVCKGASRYVPESTDTCQKVQIRARETAQMRKCAGGAAEDVGAVARVGARVGMRRGATTRTKSKPRQDEAESSASRCVRESP